MAKKSYKQLKKKIKNKKSLQLPQELLQRDADDATEIKSTQSYAVLNMSRKEARKEKRAMRKKKKTGNIQGQQQKRSYEDKPDAPGTSGATGPQKKKRKRRHKKKPQAAVGDEGGTVKGGKPPPAPWEVDPVIAQEEADLRQLEKKLGIKGGGKTAEKAKKKLAKEMQLDGFDDGFMDFLDDLDRIADLTGGETGVPETGNDASGSDIEDLATEVDPEIADLPTDVEESDNEDLLQFNDGDSEEESGDGQDAQGEAGNDQDGDEFNEDNSKIKKVTFQADQQEENEHSSDSSQEDDASSSEKHTYKPVKGQDIYGRDLDEANLPSSQQKYIPPHLRKKEDPSEADDVVTKNEDYIKLKRVLNGLMNRVTDSTLEQSAQQLGGLYRTHPTAYLNRLFFESVMALCINETQLRTSFIQIYMSLASAIHYTVGSEVGAFLLESFTLKFLEEYKRAKASPDDKLQDTPKTTLNLVLVIAYLYEFQIVHCALVYDIIRMLLEGFEGLDIELLLMLLQNCGHQLRSDDPAALKDIILSVKSQSCASLQNEGSSSSQELSSSRVQYMLDTIMDIKNNKQRKTQVYNRERATKLRKMVGHFKSAKGGGKGSSVPLRVNLKDLTETETKGRWWRIGASWVGNQANDTSLSKKGNIQRHDPAPQEQSEEMITAASKQRMNTDVRKSIFFSIMGADDFEDAFERLVKLNLKGSQEHEIIKVLLDCCAQEKAYNPYYAHLASRFCEYDSRFKFTLQLSFWDYFKQFDDSKAMPPRKCANLAKILAHLLSNLSLSLAVTKAADMSQLPRAGALFFRVVFDQLFLELSDDQFITVFDRIAGAKDCLTVKENLSIFLHEHMKQVPSFWPDESKRLFKKRRKIAKGCLDTMAMLDMMK